MNSIKLTWICLTFSLSQTLAETPAWNLEGYWAHRNNPDPYESYVRLQGDRGFLCVLDQKSSFRFQVIGDSITTPMNGMDALTWYPGSGDVEISGIEKGEPYRDRFEPIDSVTYFAKCRAEESLIPMTQIKQVKRSRTKMFPGRFWRDLLGRR